MHICRSCGKELTEEANFCPHCGLRTEKGEIDNVRTPVDRRPHWEKDLELAVQNATKVLEEAVEVAKKGLKRVTEEIRLEVDKARELGSQKSVSLYCSNCGAKNPSDSYYCTKCGRRLNK